MNILEVRNLVKVYPAFRLRGVSFSIGEGRIAGFVGRNGAGKTTTVKSVLNLVHPDSGEVSFFGLPAAQNEAEIKQRTGYSAGAVSWYPRKKLREIAGVVRRFYSSWDGDAYRRYLELFRLDEDKTPLQMSDGMRVKCSLLLALSHRAELLILDEPTSGLDPFSRSELLDVFTGLKNDGVSVLFSTHIVSDLEKCADDIICIKNGAIAAAMPKTEFLKTRAGEGESLEDAILRLERSGEDA